jgi:hypothetical protein
MKNFIKIILIISVAVSGLGLFAQPALALPPLPIENLVVQFNCGTSTCPMFGAVNFVPGQTVTGWAKVTNNTAQTKKIAAETINENDPGNFASQLNLVIKEGSNVLYNNTLAGLFSAGEIFLSNLAGNGTQTQYDFEITFNPQNTDAQGKSLGFDIIIGFQGEEGGGGGGGGGSSGGGGGSGGGGSGGGGGGGGLAPGLTIADDLRIIDIQQVSTTITWKTSYTATSQVVYGAEGEAHTLDLSDTTGTPPKYGYAHTTPETDTAPRVMNHSVTITGLTPGTTYYFRAISHGSLAISKEYTFTTLAVIPPEQFEQPVETAPEIPAQQGAVKGAQTENTSNLSVGGAQDNPEILQETSGTDQLSDSNPNLFLAGLAGIWSKVLNSRLTLFILILAAIIIFLFLLFKRRKKDEAGD